MERTSGTLQKDAQKINAEDQELLRSLVKKGVLELKPTLDKTGIRYIEAEETWGKSDSKQVKDILKNMEKKGALQSEFVDRVLTCPDCGSPDVHSKYTCPKCNSHNVEYTELLEHMKCGYIGSRGDFTKDSSLVCPNCKAELTEEASNYRLIGSCYQCEKCGYRFDKPDILHICQKCGNLFTHQDAKYLKTHTYKITDETVNDFGRELPILESIEKILIDKGFKVQLRPKITGASGVRHPFDIMAERGETSLVIDISLTGNKNDMISLLGKKIDVNPTKALIIDLSDFDELTQLGKVYDIAVIKDTKNHNFKNILEKYLETLD